MFRPRQRSSFQPDLETLEHREVPAVLAVTTFADVVNPTDGKVSLREAIARANATPAPDTIVLQAGVYKIAIPYNPANPEVNATGSFDVLASTSFVGAGASKTIINGAQLDRVFAVTGSSPSSIGVTLQRLTITGGNVGGDGGGLLVGNANVTLRGCTVAANKATGDGGGLSNALQPGTGNVTLVNTTVSRNVAGENGGGLSVQANLQGLGSVLTTRGSTIRHNLARDGGGLFATTATLTKSIVNGNRASRDGGGIHAATTTLTDSIVSGNTSSSSGGGIFASGATLVNSTVNANNGNDGGGINASLATLTSSTVSDNTASRFGGGIEASRATLTSSTVSGNNAVDGGGLFVRTATLTNCTVSGNHASRFGGGITVFPEGVNLLNVTVTENSAHVGGGVYLSQGGTSNIRNSILAANLVDLDGEGPDLSGSFTSLGHNLIGDGSGSTGFTNGVNGDQVGTAENPIDPRLAPLANNGGPTLTHALLPGSRAIDRGDNTDAPATDQRGVVRPRDGDGNGSRLVDVGAFEL